MLPIIVFAAVLVPLLVIAFLAVRRSKVVGEHPAGEDDSTRARTEQEFADAEAYQEQWREEEKQHPRDTIL